VIQILIIELSVENHMEWSGGEPVQPVSQRVRRGTDKNWYI